MKLVPRVLTIVLSLTLVAGLALGAYLLWLYLAPTPTVIPTVEFRAIAIADVVTVTANLRGEQLTRAELWSENQLLAREVNPNPALANVWSVAWRWTPPGAGVYPLAARAFDQAGRYGASSLFEIVVPPRQRLIYSSNRSGNSALAPADAQSGRGRYALYATAVNSGETAPFNLAQSEDRQPNVSSTQVVAFTSNRGGAWHVLTRALMTTQLTDITPDLASAQHPAWSADGQKLAFEVTISDTTSIFVGDARGQNRKQVTHGETYDGQATFSPSGDRIAFAAQRGGQWDVYSIQLDGTDLTRLTSDAAQDWQPAWAPDGARIAFASNRSGISQIYVMAANGEAGQPVRLTNFPGGAEQPAWSPDGKWLAFVAYTGEGEGNHRREIYVLYAPQSQAPGENRGWLRLTQNAYDDTEPAWMK